MRVLSFRSLFHTAPFLLQDIVEGTEGTNLVTSSIMIDLGGLRGSLKAGLGEVVALLTLPLETDPERVLEVVEITSPAGMTKSSIREIHKADALYAG
jgi:hypothetical protein